MLRNNLGVIDLENMNETERFVIGTFLNKHRPTLLKKSATYSITESDIIFQFSFANNLLLRKRKSGKEGFRYEVIDRIIGTGGDGTVYLSRGTLRPNASLTSFKQKKRAVKEFNDGIDATIEYGYSILVPHLHAKPLTITESSRFPPYTAGKTYLTEAFMSGENLYEVIQDEKYTALRYTTDERIQLSINILSAIQDQVHKIGLIHRDIKPENIMIDQLSARVIDYRYCKKADDTTSKPDPAGTPVISPPEQFAYCPIVLQKYTLKSDSYSTGKTLAEFWRAKAEANSIKTHNYSLAFSTIFAYAQKDTHYKYSKFLTGDLTTEHAAQVKNMFEQLARTKPEDRWTLDQAISCLKQIQKERLANSVNKNLRSSKE